LIHEKYSQFFLVALQFVTAAALVLSSSRDLLGNPAALLMVAGGSALGVWSWVTFGLRRITIMPAVRDDAELVTHGPYQFIRHPMYTAVLLFCGGFTLSPLEWWRTVTWLVLLLVVWIKSKIEEKVLLDRFNEYSRYRRGTGRFFPRLSNRIPAERNK
jgi:protein-S-isoprenylcysteine O-methyltransferase Ste14